MAVFFLACAIHIVLVFLSSSHLSSSTTTWFFLNSGGACVLSLVAIHCAALYYGDNKKGRVIYETGFVSCWVLIPKGISLSAMLPRLVKKLEYDFAKFTDQN